MHSRCCFSKKKIGFLCYPKLVFGMALRAWLLMPCNTTLKVREKQFEAKIIASSATCYASSALSTSRVPQFIDSKLQCSSSVMNRACFKERKNRNVLEWKAKIPRNLWCKKLNKVTYRWVFVGERNSRWWLESDFEDFETDVSRFDALQCWYFDTIALVSTSLCSSLWLSSRDYWKLQIRNRFSASNPITDIF